MFIVEFSLYEFLISIYLTKMCTAHSQLQLVTTAKLWVSGVGLAWAGVERWEGGVLQSVVPEPICGHFMGKLVLIKTIEWP